MIARLAVLGVLASWRLATGQGPGGGAWTVTPARATVGDTVWVERVVGAPVGWRVRAGRFEGGEAVEALADPAVDRVGGSWRVRYALVAWVPGNLQVTLPPLWLLGPDGRADSLPAGTAGLVLASVLPDTGGGPEPRPALLPVRERPRRAAPVVGAVVLVAGLLVAGVRWRRRGPRAVPRPATLPAGPAIGDARWLAAGEPRAVAARAAARLRGVVARVVPAAHEALSAAECRAVLERARPDAAARDIGDVLRELNEVQFGAAYGGDVAALARRARALAEELER